MFSVFYFLKIISYLSKITYIFYLSVHKEILDRKLTQTDSGFGVRFESSL